MSDPRAKFVLQMQQDLAAERSNWERRWQLQAELIRPMRSDFTVTRAEGEERTQKLYDSTALLAQDNLASGLWSQITNAANVWFSLKHPDEEIDRQRDVRAWLERASKTMLAAFGGSGQRFYAQALEVYRDAPTFGTAVFYNEFRPQQADVYFRALPLHECYIGSNQWHEVDKVFRKFEMTARQAVQAFGEEAFPANSGIRRAADKRPFERHSFIHAVLPIDEMEVDKRQKQSGKAYASLWVGVDDAVVLRESGYYELPYQVPRWSQASRGVYGDSQADLAMPDIRMVNTMARTTLSGAELAVKPPLLAPNESAVRGANRRGLRTGPQSIIYGGVTAEGRPLYQPLITGANVGLGLEMEEQRRHAIREAFFFSLLQMVGAPNATATEVLQREEEKLRLMGPQLGRLQSEFLDPLIDRVFGILLREGAFGPEEAIPEPLLEQSDIAVAYVSPLARAQRVSEAASADRFVASLGSLASVTGDPSVWDNVDQDALAQTYGEAYGIAQSVLVDPETRDARRQERVQAQQAQQLAAQAPGAARALKDVAEIADAGGGGPAGEPGGGLGGLLGGQGTAANA